MRAIFLLLLSLFFLKASGQPDNQLYESLKSASFSNPDSVIQLTKWELRHQNLSQEEKAYYCFLTSIALRNLGDFTSGISYADSALWLANEDVLKANSYHNKAVCYRYLGEYDSAITYNLKALNIFEEVGDVEEQAIVLNSLGVVNMKSGDYDRALEYYNQTLAINHETDVDNLSDVLNNIAIIYANTGKLDSSEIYFRKSLDYERQVKNLKGISAGLNNLGALKYYQEDLDSAIIYFQKSLQIDKRMGDKQGIPAVMSNIAEVAIQNEDYALAESYLDSSITMSKTIGSKRDLENAYLNKAGLYQSQGDFEEAFNHLVVSKAYADSLINEEKGKAIAELETQYETEKKEQQIVIQQAKIAEQQAQNERNLAIMAGLVFVIILLVTIVLLLRSRARKKQELLLQEAEILLREAQIEAAIDSQEKERTRFARDLHDGFGQMISVLNLNLKSLEKEGADSHQVFEQSAKVLEEMYQELKGICFNLMPQTLIKSGITAAMNEFASRISQTGRLMLQTDFFGLEDRLPEVQEISLYRITQEWINNILKYGDADRINIQITKDEQEITLLIEDNGSGFDLNLLMKAGKGNGWRNMNSRANLMKGELEVDTTPGIKGNTLIVNAPVFEPQTVVHS